MSLAPAPSVDWMARLRATVQRVPIETEQNTLKESAGCLDGTTPKASAPLPRSCSDTSRIERYKMAARTYLNAGLERPQAAWMGALDTLTTPDERAFYFTAQGQLKTSYLAVSLSADNDTVVTFHKSGRVSFWTDKATQKGMKQ